MGEGFGGERIHVCVWLTLCCSPETITTLLIGYTPLQNVFGVKKKKKYLLGDRVRWELGVIKNPKGFWGARVFQACSFQALNFPSPQPLISKMALLNCGGANTNLVWERVDNSFTFPLFENLHKSKF